MEKRGGRKIVDWNSVRSWTAVDGLRREGYDWGASHKEKARVWGLIGRSEGECDRGASYEDYIGRKGD